MSSQQARHGPPAQPVHAANCCDRTPPPGPAHLYEVLVSHQLGEVHVTSLAGLWSTDVVKGSARHNTSGEGRCTARARTWPCFVVRLPALLTQAAEPSPHLVHGHVVAEEAAGHPGRRLRQPCVRLCAMACMPQLSGKPLTSSRAAGPWHAAHPPRQSRLPDW